MTSSEVPEELLHSHCYSDFLTAHFFLKWTLLKMPTHFSFQKVISDFEIMDEIQRILIFFVYDLLISLFTSSFSSLHSHSFPFWLILILCMDAGGEKPPIQGCFFSLNKLMKK